jgi:N-acetyl sugar amidotransferase
MNREYQICQRCVMDTTDQHIIFDDQGICNHCKGALLKLKDYKFENDSIRKQKLDDIVNKIKIAGKGKKYDCIIGLSGGVDSSYLAYIAVNQLGLRPLAIHVDNGWNSELAVQNIENIVKKLAIDLYTWVIDWDEFKDLQKAYLKASVIDLEVLSDNAIVIAIEKMLRKHHIKYFLIGHNYQAESIMPSSWIFTPKFDSLNIKSIYKKFGNHKKLKTYPLLGFIGYIQYRYFNKRIMTNILDLVEYNKNDAINILYNEFGWRDYGGKHYESKITHFYQAYLLPEKFGVDKRKAHLSSLICSGQISREEAIEELNKPLYDSSFFEQDKEYFIKKLELTNEEFDNILKKPAISHFSYPSYNKLIYYLSKLLKRKPFKGPMNFLYNYL